MDELVLMMKRIFVFGATLLLALGLPCSIAFGAQSGVPRFEDQRFQSDTPTAGEGFAFHIAMDGEWAAASIRLSQVAAFHAGAIRLYRRTETGFGFFQEVYPPQLVQSLAMGSYDLQLKGNLLVVSALYYPALIPGESSKVFVYEFDGVSWGPAATLEPLNWDFSTEVGFGFGACFTIVDQDTIAVCAPASLHPPSAGLPQLSTQLTMYGDLYFYRRTATGWAFSQRLMPRFPHPGGSNGMCGVSIASCGDTIVVGNSQWGVPSPHSNLFERDSQGVWHAAGFIRHPQIWWAHQLGYSIAMEGDLLVVAEPGVEFMNIVYVGFVLVYRKGQTGWQLEATLRASDGVINIGTGGRSSDRFGESVSISDGRILVGAPSAQPDMGGRRLGSAYLFEHVAGQWTETHRLWENNVPVYPSQSASVGSDVVLQGDTAFVANDLGVAAGIHWAGTASMFYLPFGELVCDGQTNSTGNAATMEISGSRKTEFGHLRLRVNSLPVGFAGYALAGRASTLVPNAGGSMGNLCVGGQLARLKDQVQLSDASGQIDVGVPMGQMPTEPVSAIAAGETWYFQMWYRDGAASNFSDAVSVVFQ
ncbi:MAG: hypothetical protein GY759_09535 [Chloroflexi bacterium]|nr:hypothetical protein [Chloroflexota bacterium]